MRDFIKRLSNVVAAFVIVFPAISLLATKPVLAFSAGDGTASNPFQINNCSDLLDVDDDLTKAYIVMADLNCSANGNAASIGSQGTGFTGIFKGNSHTITVTIDTDIEDQAGFFRRTDAGAVISELTIAGTVDGNQDTGGLVGLANGTTISNVQVSATVNGGRYVGGIVGNSNQTDILGSTATGNVTSAATYAGGAVGKAYEGSIESTTASGVVTGQNYSGGLAGGIDYANVRYSSASGAVTGNDNVGGLIGSAYYSVLVENIFQSYATGTVTGRHSTGGLVGELGTGEIAQSYATGNVIATNGDDVGGLVGRGVGGSSLEIFDSYSTSDVTAAGDAGGVIGYGNATAHVVNVYAAGTLFTSSWLGLGGIIGGGDPAPMENSFWDTTTTNAVSACYSEIAAEDCGGTGLATSLMKTAETFTNATWNFNSVWAIDSAINDGYPYLISRPYMLCEMAVMTSTTGSTACDITYDRPPNVPLDTTWQSRYRVSGATDWIYIDIDNVNEGRMIFHGLEPATEYDLGLKPNNDLTDVWGTLVGVTLGADSDLDGDGTLDSIENNSPNNGDANDDGTLDSMQGNMTAVNNSLTNKYTVLQTDCTSNSSVAVSAESSSNKDAGYDYAAGLLGFNSTGCGVNVTVTQYFFGDYDLSKITFRKYNSVTHIYSTINTTLSNVTIDGQTALKIVYTVADNSALDEDATVGTIKDPSGPAVAVVGVPNTGLEIR